MSPGIVFQRGESAESRTCLSCYTLLGQPLLPAKGKSPQQNECAKKGFIHLSWHIGLCNDEQYSKSLKHLLYVTASLQL